MTAKNDAHCEWLNVSSPVRITELPLCVCVPWVNANNLINNCPNKNLCVYACSLQYYIQLIARIRRQRVRRCCYRCCGCCCFFSSSFEWTCFFVYNTNTRAHTQNVIKTLNEPISVKQLKSIAYFLH